MENNSEKGKIGVFDSGLGGLVVLRELRKVLPEYDYVFYGDQKNLPYGNKTVDELFVIAKENLSYLFDEQDCRAVFIACNTISSNLYDKLKEWILVAYPDRFIFGIAKGTVDALASDTHFTVFATVRTIASHRFSTLLTERFPDCTVDEVALPELCSRIEAGENVEDYLATFCGQFKEKGTCVLGCTHYGIVAETFANIFPGFTTIAQQEKILPQFFKEYLAHRETIRSRLSVGGTLQILISADNPVFREYANKWFPNTEVVVV
jgi:glutamate racemase